MSIYTTPPSPAMLLRAARIVRERGLMRGKFQDPDDPVTGAVCLLGACALAAGSDDPDDGAWMIQVTEFLAERLNGGTPDPFPFLTVTRFSDLSGDAERVAGFLESAAEAIE